MSERINMIDTGSTTSVVSAIGLTKVFRDFWFRTKARAVDNIDFGKSVV